MEVMLFKIALILLFKDSAILNVIPSAKSISIRVNGYVSIILTQRREKLNSTSHGRPD